MSKIESHPSGHEPRPSTLDLRTSVPPTLLLIKPGSLGDVVHALPVAAALHDAMPGTKLAWVVDPRWQPILEGNPAISRCIPFPREQFRGVTGTAKAVGWFAGLRDLQPSVAVDLQCLLRSALVAACSRAGRRIGLSDAREGAARFYHATAAVNDRMHAVDRYLAVLPLLGVAIPEHPRFDIGAGDPIPGFDTTGFVLLHPFARGAGKSLSADHVRRMCEMLSPRPVVLAGVGNAPSNLPANTHNLANRTTLRQLIWLIRRAATVISVDSGPMHLAAAANVPLLSIHTWSDPRKVGPHSETAFIWQGGEIRRQSLRGDAPLLPEQPINETDLEAIATWGITVPPASS